ncbi:hypothetical protein FE840_001395 [Peteryoungia desertarenae]|uniref:Uncharacterized protein n=1 Tax=Peteryoungia desertarenae TaxID=1813451 RepID=A0ABX6QIB5_9HYPH|nr:hypothetical protein [Peteryoungia desertarenae]QLF68314.1 hypothetical protein FE840_001395 [Peteryoungia desertarenae]
MEADYWPYIITASSGLLGTVIGSAATILTQVVMKSQDRRYSKRSLAFGLAAEIESYLALMERRGHAKNMEEFVQLLRSGQNLPMPDLTDHPESRREYFPILKSHFSSLGTLGADLCRKIAEFHRTVDAILLTTEAAKRGEYNHLSPFQKADLIEKELVMWREATKAGGELVNSLYRS